MPQCCRVDMGSRGKHWQASSSVTFEEEQQAGCCKEGEMYLVILPSNPPRPTQAREGVATNGWLSWKSGFSSSSSSFSISPGSLLPLHWNQGSTTSPLPMWCTSLLLSPPFVCVNTSTAKKTLLNSTRSLGACWALIFSLTSRTPKRPNAVSPDP